MNKKYGTRVKLTVDKLAYSKGTIHHAVLGFHHDNAEEEDVPVYIVHGIYDGGLPFYLDEIVHVDETGNPLPPEQENEIIEREFALAHEMGEEYRRFREELNRREEERLRRQGIFCRVVYLSDGKGNIQKSE